MPITQSRAIRIIEAGLAFQAAYQHLRESGLFTADKAATYSTLMAAATTLAVEKAHFAKSQARNDRERIKAAKRRRQTGDINLWRHDNPPLAEEDMQYDESFKATGKAPT